jgi:D-threo-aldose 1-dehydrogenase
MSPSWRRLGRSDVSVPSYGLGTAWLGGLGTYPAVEAAETQEIFEEAIRLDFRLFDTAPQYGFGYAESRVGDALQLLPRSEIVLSTKTGLRVVEPDSIRVKAGRALRRIATDPTEALTLARRVAGRGASRVLPGPVGSAPGGSTPGPAGRSVFDFSYDGVLRSFEASLGRLRVDSVDVLHIHDPDEHYAEALGDAYRAVLRLKEEGVVRAIGVGMNQSALLTRFARDADFDCFLLAGRYTLLDQTALDDLLPVCVERTVSLIIGGVFNSGILIDPRPGALFNYEPADEARLARAQALAAVCGRHGVPLAAAALQFPLAHPAVATVLTGVRTKAELAENARLASLPIPDDLWAELKHEGLLPEAAPVPAADGLERRPS